MMCLRGRIAPVPHKIKGIYVSKGMKVDLAWVISQLDAVAQKRKLDTQKEVAKYLGLSENDISKVHKGHVSKATASAIGMTMKRETRVVFPESYGLEPMSVSEFSSWLPDYAKATSGTTAQWEKDKGLLKGAVRSVKKTSETVREDILQALGLAVEQEMVWRKAPSGKDGGLEIRDDSLPPLEDRQAFADDFARKVREEFVSMAEAADFFKTTENRLQRVFHCARPNKTMLRWMGLELGRKYTYTNKAGHKIDAKEFHRDVNHWLRKNFKSEDQAATALGMTVKTLREMARRAHPVTEEVCRQMGSGVTISHVSEYRVPPNLNWSWIRKTPIRGLESRLVKKRQVEEDGIQGVGKKALIPVQDEDDKVRRQEKLKDVVSVYFDGDHEEAARLMSVSKNQMKWMLNGRLNVEVVSVVAHLDHGHISKRAREHMAKARHKVPDLPRKSKDAGRY